MAQTVKISPLLGTLEFIGDISSVASTTSKFTGGANGAIALTFPAGTGLTLTGTLTVSGAAKFGSILDSANSSGANGFLITANGSGGYTWTAPAAASDTLDDVTDRGNTTTNTITVGGTTSNYLLLTGTSTLLDTKGILKWDTDHNTVALYYDTGQHIDIGQTQVWYVKNTSGSTILKGQVVMATGAVGNSGSLEVQPLIANGSVSGKFALGIAKNDIANGLFGFVVTEGTIRGVDTSAYSVGTVLWANPDIPGELTSVEPTAPALKLPIAFVVSAASNGAIGVRMTQGLDLSEVHDVNISSIANGQLLRYNNGIWENWSPNFLTSYTETDPIFTASAAAGITITDISNWNTAYSWGNHASAGYATTSYVNTAVSNLVDSAPGTLDTLNELAAALGDDPNFATTISTALSNRLRIDINNQGLTSIQQANGRTNLGLDNAYNNEVTAVAVTGTTTKTITLTQRDGGTLTTTFTDIDTNTTYTAGAGLTLTGTTFSHTDTSSQASVDNSAGTVIQDITLDTYGHITALGSVNLDGRYYTETESDARFVNVTGDTVTGDLIISSAALSIISTVAESEAFYVDGVNGRLFTITDSLDNSLFSVNTIAGLPVIEAFADNSVTLGPFSSPVTITTGGAISTVSHGGSADWKSAYDNQVTAITVTGTATKTITLTQQDGGTLSANFTDTSNAYTAGAGLTLTGSEFAHADTSSQTSINNSNGVVIQDVTLDTYGHVTALVSLDLDGRYYTETEIGNILNGTTALTGYNKSNWDAAYNDKINSAAVTGTTTKTLTLTQQDGGTVTATWADLNTNTTYSLSSAANVSSGVDIKLTGSDSVITTATLRGAGAAAVSYDVANDLIIITATDTNTTYSAGAGLTLTGTTFSHTDTSSQASVDNANGTVIQDITLDTYGHITALGSVNLDGRYYTETEVAAFFAGTTAITGYSKTNWDAAYNDKVNSIAVTGTTTKTITLTQQDGGTLTASFSDLDNNTTYFLSGELTAPNVAHISLTGSDSSITSFFIEATGSASVNYDPGSGTVFIGATDTNTTYSAGAGLTLTGTTFSHTDTSSQASVDNSAGTVIQDITLDTYGHITAIGSVNLDGRYYTETEVAAFFAGTTAITGYNKSNWDTAFGWGNHASASYATTTYVNTAVSNLIDAAPGTLDTLNELAAALGDDPNFATTVTNSIATKMNLYNGATTSDYNAITTNGIVRNQGGANGPAGTAHSTMFTALQSDGNYGFQIASTGNDAVYFRHKDTTFAAWQQFASRSWVTSQGFTGNTGTVTSVAMTVPTGFAVTGTPITSSGTLALAFAAGYALPTSASQTTWNAAYNDKVNSIAVTGTTTKTLTLTQQDGGTLTATWTDIDTNTNTTYFLSGELTAPNVAHISLTGSDSSITSFFIEATGSASVNYDPGSGTVFIGATDTNTTYTAGAGLTLTGTTFSHTDTSSQASVNNSNGVVIQDVTLDTYGHVTGLVSLDLDGRYYTETEVGNFFSGTTAITGYNKSNWDAAYNDKINSAAVTGTSTKTLTLTQQDGGTVTASWTDADTNTTYSLGGSLFAANIAEIQLSGSDASITSVRLKAIGSSTIDFDPGLNTIVIGSSDTNTTYTAGAGLTLTGTTFSHTDTSSQASVDNSDGTVIQDITLDTYGHITALGSVNLDGRYYTKVDTDEQISPSLRSNVIVHGGGTITVNATRFVKWSSRFIVISNGRGSRFATAGFFDINCPTSGTITGAGGAANRTATVDGIQLNDWEALYYILPVGSSSASVPANFRVVSYTADLTIPHTWVQLCARNGDSNVYNFAHGINILAGDSSTSYETSLNTANTSVARDGSGNFTAGTITAALSGNATTATTLQTARTINGVSFNGSANIDITANTTNSITFNNSGSGATSGATFNGSAARTISYNTIGAAALGHTHDQYIEKDSTSFTGASFIMAPEAPDTGFIGLPGQHYSEVHTRALFTYGYHESGLSTQNIGRNQTGTVVVWKDGKLQPCAKFGDHMVMGVISHGSDSPIVMGAEPVLVTGPVSEGDYLLTSDKEGHAIAMSREEVISANLIDLAFAKALESGDGDSHTVKAMINKL